MARPEEIALAKKSFSDEEWKTIAAAPAIAGMYAALSSEREVTDKEWEALGLALDPGSAPAEDAMLQAALLDTQETVNQALTAKQLPALELGDINMTDVDAVRRAALDYFRRVNAALRDAPMETQRRYKDAVLLVAQKVAEAQAEGGFLGIGARDISAGEVQALKDIAGSFGYDTSEGSDWSRSIVVPASAYQWGRWNQ
jgi:hypothetical protein